VKAMLGPVSCQGCGLPVAWFGTCWSADGGHTAHRCREQGATALPCLCGGSVIVNGDVARGVKRHQQTAAHRYWRRQVEAA
jgi:hypothetical protein